jgi:hypothetical protein
MQIRKPLQVVGVPLLAYFTAVGLGLLTATFFGSLSAGFNEPDEASHFLNSVFVRDYLHDALGANPMTFASNYYMHYPKLAIGHWPPAYYLFFGLAFLVLPSTPKVALILNILVSTLPVIGLAALTHRLAGAVAAILASVWYISMPVVIWSMQFFLLDQAVTAAIIAAAAAWVGFSLKPTLQRALVVAALASTAVMIKGNGWLVALFPIFHIGVTGRWKLLADKYTYVALVAALLLVVPWYALTAGISADGFNFRPGVAYAWLALETNARVLLDNVGAFGLAFALLGAWFGWTARRSDQVRWETVAACIALIFATLLFQALLPAALEDRYMAPALPPLVILATLGIWASYDKARIAGRTLLPLSFAGAAVFAASYPSLLFLLHPGAKGNLRLDSAAEQIVKDGGPAIWIIDGSTSAEGALAAEVAIRDPARQIYVVRSSQLLAASDFMGFRYQLKFHDLPDVLREVQSLGAEGLISVEASDRSDFQHSAQLRAALRMSHSGYEQVTTLQHARVPGQTVIYRTSEPRTPDFARLRAINFPAKAGALGLSQQAP